jgi:HlyD family secretion protein
MSIWWAVPVGAVIVAALTVVKRHDGSSRVYVGIIESCLGMSNDHDCLQVRTYVDERLVRDLRAPSTLIGRMLIRATDLSVPLTFVRVPPYVPLRSARSEEWQEREDVPVLPVIFRFDPMPDLAIHAGQLVDVCVAVARGAV